jgi:hypothetical protein
MAVVCFSNRFVFLKTRKTAGTSLQSALATRLLPGDISTIGWTNTQTGDTAPIQEFPSRHEIEDLYPETSDYFWFGFTRNPFDLVVSRFHYQVAQKRINVVPTVDAFNEWAQRVYFVGEPGFPNGRYVVDRTRSLLFDLDFRPLVDFIGRYESLVEDFEKLTLRLGLGVLPIPHLNGSNRSRGQRWFDSKTRGLVETHFDFELQYFGYTFR